MNTLTFKAILIRYALAVVLISLAGFVRQLGNLQLDSWFFIIVVAIVCIKFLVYDGITYAIHRKWPTFRIHPWLILGYALALILDMLATWASASGETDAGFAFLATVFYTPWILAGALVVMILHTWVATKKNGNPSH